MDTNAQTRTSLHHIPVITIGGSITAKLRANGVVVDAPGNRNEHACLVTVTHQSGSYCAIQFRQSSSNVVGTGSNLGGQMGVVPGGAISTVIYPNKPFIEVVAAAGSGNVRVQMDSRVEWERMAFAKTDLGVPPSLWKAENVTPESLLPD